MKEQSLYLCFLENTNKERSSSIFNSCSARSCQVTLDCPREALCAPSLRGEAACLSSVVLTTAIFHFFACTLSYPNRGDLRELARVPLRGEGSCGRGGAPRDSAGSGATEEVGPAHMPNPVSAS